MFFWKKTFFFEKFFFSKIFKWTYFDHFFSKYDIWWCKKKVFMSFFHFWNCSKFMSIIFVSRWFLAKKNNPKIGYFHGFGRKKLRETDKYLKLVTSFFQKSFFWPLFDISTIGLSLKIILTKKFTCILIYSYFWPKLKFFSKKSWILAKNAKLSKLYLRL